jgi:hypothetical protein
LFQQDVLGFQVSERMRAAGDALTYARCCSDGSS